MVPYCLVLGTAQDGGRPQAGCRLDCCAGAPEPLYPSCVAVVDPGSRRGWLLDATPRLPEQLRLFERESGCELAGIFLTHAHIGHYLGLAHLGKEVMDCAGLPLYVMPRMAEFLRLHAPWQQLLAGGNAELVLLAPERPQALAPGLQVEALPVPHRDELSETVAFRITGPRRSALYLPDIDRWRDWRRPLREVLAEVDRAWLDGTFFSSDELLGRDPAQVPHPPVRTTLELLEGTQLASRVHFIHLNHTNPILHDGPERRHAIASGAGIASRGQRFRLG